MKKALALLLSLLMLVSLLIVPVSAGADDGFNDGQFGDWGDGPVNPDVPDEPVQGTKENPYPVAKPSSFPTSIELKAGTSVYYQFPALKFNGWTLTGFALTGIEVNGVMNTEISLIDRAIKITLSNDGDLVGFFNDSEEDVTAVLDLKEPLGTAESPYRLEEGANEITIPEIHYEFYAEYTTAVPGEYTFDVSNFDDFEVYFDANRYDDANELVELTEALTLELEAGTPVAYILRPVNGVFDVTLTVTAPAKGSANNPYYLSSYDEILAGVDGLCGTWPATAEGVYYNLDGGFNGKPLLVTGAAPLSVTVNGTTWTKDGEGQVTLEIPLELDVATQFVFKMLVKSGSDVKFDVVYPVGDSNNPLVLNKGKNTLSLDEWGNAYYATYTAERDGVLILKPNTVSGLGYTDANNLTSGDFENGYDYIFIDPEGLNSSPDNVLKIQVSKGDQVLVSACAGENEDLEINAMDLVLTVSYEGDVEITTQPKTTYVKMGAKISLKVTAKGDGLKYQWYFMDSGKTKYSKSTNKTATYSSTLTKTSKGRKVYCIVTDKYGNSVKSAVCSIREAASITTQPKTSYAKKGATIKVTVKASGDGLKYTWYFKNAGASKYTKSSITSATYSTTMSATTKGRMVYCVVKDKWGKTVTTSKATLRESVSVTTQPKTASFKKNTTAKATVKASGDGLTYTWYFKNAGKKTFSKSSIKTATYSCKMTATTKNRQVYCVVKDKWGKTVKTVTVTLKMK